MKVRLPAGLSQTCRFVFLAASCPKRLGHQAQTSADILAPPSPADVRLFGETGDQYNGRVNQNFWMHDSHIKEFDDDQVFSRLEVQPLAILSPSMRVFV